MSQDASRCGWQRLDEVRSEVVNEQVATVRQTEAGLPNPSGKSQPVECSLLRPLLQQRHTLQHGAAGEPAVTTEALGLAPLAFIPLPKLVGESVHRAGIGGALPAVPSRLNPRLRQPMGHVN